jgi:hypothetical protein
MRSLTIQDRSTLEALDRIARTKGTRPAAVVRALIAHADPEGATLGGPGSPQPPEDGTGEVLAALEALTGTSPWTLGEVYERMVKDGALLEAIRIADHVQALSFPRPGSPPRLGSRHQIGNYLRRIKWKTAGGRRLTQRGQNRMGAARWLVERVGAGPTAALRVDDGAELAAVAAAGGG